MPGYDAQQFPVNSERLPINEGSRVVLQNAAYVADPCTKRIIDTRDSTIAIVDIDLIRQGLDKLLGRRPMTAPRLPAEEIAAEEAPLIVGELEALAQTIPTESSSRGLEFAP